MDSDSTSTALPSFQSLRDCHVVIVGGSSGIGKATAKAVCDRGGRVTLVSRSSEKLEAARKALGAGDRVAVQSLDMTDEAAVGAWFGGLAEESVDHLVITASSAVHGRFAELETGPVRAMFDAKFWGPYAVARAALPKLRDGGSITFFSGVLSRRPGLNCSGLGAVNSAVEGLTRALALELGPRLRINCCSPGMVRSEAYAKMPEDKREAMYAATGESLPLGRVGSTEEIANAVLMMMTNGYLTGQVIDVDGGHMVRQYATR
ncbi:MAG: SDR family oxidoreductase [Kiloniellales bacterium]|nr:SDR family oxidoreductase [Kiloniellales bacterium]